MTKTEPAMFQRICAVPDAEGNRACCTRSTVRTGPLLACIGYEHFGQPRWFADLVELPAVSIPVDEVSAVAA